MNLNKFRESVGKRAPEILLVIGLGELIATVVVASKASVKAHEVLSEKEVDYFEDTGEDLPAVEAVKTVAPCYIPTGLMLVGTIGTICMSHYILTKRNAALAIMMSIAQNTVTAYQDEILEKFGPKKLEEVEDDIAKKHVQENPPTEIDMNVPTTDGFMLCFDDYSKRYFRSNEDRIRRAFNSTLNPKLISEQYITYNDYCTCAAVGLEPVDYGDEAVWRDEVGIVEPKFTYDTYCGQPLCIVTFWTKPTALKYRWG